VGAPAVYTNIDGRFGLFVTSRNNFLYDAQRIPYTLWYQFGGAFTGTPAVSMSPGNRLELFVLGVDGALYHKWQVAPGGGWSDWYSHGKPPSLPLDEVVNRAAETTEPPQ
jgi:hypothetical protein